MNDDSPSFRPSSKLGYSLERHDRAHISEFAIACSRQEWARLLEGCYICEIERCSHCRVSEQVVAVTKESLERNDNLPISASEDPENSRQFDYAKDVIDT